MRKIKGFQKLAIQIGILSASMIAISFLTETDLWNNYFNYFVEASEKGCRHTYNSTTDYSSHYHWNYRGWVYLLTGFVFFILSVIKIGLSHKEEDFTAK